MFICPILTDCSTLHELLGVIWRLLSGDYISLLIINMFDLQFLYVNVFLKQDDAEVLINACFHFQTRNKHNYPIQSIKAV